MNNFWDGNKIRKKKVDTIQINLGNKCNLACRHCHIDASPSGSDNMTKRIAEKIIGKLREIDIKAVEFTGGEPLLNTNLAYFIKELSGIKNITVRTNLISFELPEHSGMYDFLKKHHIKIIGSLPSAFENATNDQRGKDVYNKSIKVLKKLNKIGYGKDIDLHLVYNPAGDYLPPEVEKLESDYRNILNGTHGIKFNDFISIVNVPLKRFRKSLEKSGAYDNYIAELRSRHNPKTIDKIMCRNLVSVDFDGNVYDCDFNLAACAKIKGFADRKFWEIDFTDFNPEISFGYYCYACTANTGSSCHGALVGDEPGIKESVKSYYGEKLSSSADLQTNACCTTESLPDYIKESLKYISDEIVMKYYGCGSPIPLDLEGLQALDVGCGTGRDVYVLSRLVGENGFAYGIDMTENQLSVARKYITDHMNLFGFNKTNTEFILDEIENLENHFESESIDLVISNCVINLVQDKEKTIKQIFNILKYGGEFYFSDIYADRRVPDHIASNEILYGECLGGALYYRDFERIVKRSGFTDPRIISKRAIEISNPEIKDITGNINFYSITYRLWKLKGLEDACEDYGHIAVYNGGIPYSKHRFELDKGHAFYRNKPERVCGNTALMLANSRFGKYFSIIGDFSEHFGLFEDCGNSSKGGKNDNAGSGCC